MKKAAAGSWAMCGGCYRQFTGEGAAAALKAHIEDAPCEHYRKEPRFGNTNPISNERGAHAG
jgi:hypothetical protein